MSTFEFRTITDGRLGWEIETLVDDTFVNTLLLAHPRRRLDLAGVFIIIFAGCPFGKGVVFGVRC